MKRIGNEELKKIQIDILDYVDKFCCEHHINYFLSGGTLIGAVRHKGYIPWDDDIDICMLRPDWYRFVELFSKENDADYKVHSHLIDNNFIFPYAKVSYEKTVLKEHIAHPIPMGVNIDIFPIDTIPEERTLQRGIYKRFKFYFIIHQFKQVLWSSKRSFLKNLLMIVSKCILLAVPFSFVVKKLHNNAVRYKNVNSSLCGDAVWGYGIKEITSKENFKGQVLAEFEGKHYPIPIGYDSFLKGIFGDYMQLPPERDKKSHHAFTAYWK